MKDKGRGKWLEALAEERQRDNCSVSPRLCAPAVHPLIHIYTQQQQGEDWLQRHQGQRPIFACVLGFTETGLLPGISAAGATPADRQYTAIADAEFLYHGAQAHPIYSLPPLTVGASPALISRAILAEQQIPLYLFNAGLPVSTGCACDRSGWYSRSLLKPGASDGTANRCTSAATRFSLGRKIGSYSTRLSHPG